MKKPILLLSTLSLLGVLGLGTNMNIAHAGVTPNTKSLSEVFASADVNYTRTTNMYFTSAAYDEVNYPVNHFPFTQTRTTYWIDHGLYMHNNTTDINSGYYSRESDGYNKMYHYRIEGGYVNYDSSDATLSEDAYSAEGDMNDFFTDLHYFHNVDSTYIAYFTNTGTNTWEATDSQVLTDFLAFCASCYTNPLGDWDTDIETPDTNYLGFSKAVVKLLSDGNIEYALYVDSDSASKIDNAEGKFAVATISNIGTTSIGALTSHIHNI